MAFKILECSQDDFNNRLVDIIFDSMEGRHAFINAIRPNNMTRAGREKARLGYLRVKSTDPSVKWIKAIDSETSEMLGVAQWNIYDGPKPPTRKLDGPPGTWGSTEDKEWAIAMYEAFIVHRRRAIRDAIGPVVCLSILAVDGRYQRQGVGTLLARWGTKIADDIGAECTVESTDEGRRLYEKVGFVTQKHYLLEVPMKFRDRPQQYLTFMHREAQKAEPSYREEAG